MTMDFKELVARTLLGELWRIQMRAEVVFSEASELLRKQSLRPVARFGIGRREEDAMLRVAKDYEEVASRLTDLGARVKLHRTTWLHIQDEIVELMGEEWYRDCGTEMGAEARTALIASVEQRGFGERIEELNRRPLPKDPVDQ